MIYEQEFLEKIWDLSKEFKIQQKKYEWFELLKILNDRNEKFKYGLEVGAYDGGSSISLTHFCENFITVDGNNPLRFDVNRLKQITNYEGISANSFNIETINHVKNFSPNGYDLIFIDGDHTYEGVKKDFENYFPMLNKGGIVFFHDIVDSEYHRSVNCYVSKFWDEVKNTYKTLEIKDSDNSDWGGIGVIFSK
jgi:predicted O-methyltransferase YrrM